MSSDTSELFSIPAFPLPHSRPWRSASCESRCAVRNIAGSVDKPSYLLDRYFVDGANPLLRNWSNDRFMQGPHSPWPLVLYGSSGVGKTLLAEVFVRRISKNYRYVTGPEFRRQFNEACETRSMRHFQEHFSSGDVLLIDNLTAPPGESALGFEWVRLFDSYQENNRPYVVTVPVAPFYDETLSPALRSRLSGGLSINVMPPGKAARQAIVEQLLGRYGLVADSDDIEWLSEHLPDTVMAMSREISRIALHYGSTAKLSVPDSSHRIVRKQLEDLIGQQCPRLDFRNFGILLGLVSRRFQLKGSEITGRGRQRQRVMARGVVAWLARNCFSAPYSRIGRLLGKRDASTIRHAFDRIESQRHGDSRLENLLQELSKTIEKRFAGETRNAFVS